MNGQIRVRFLPRDVPLAPTAVAATERDSVARLVRALATRSRETLASFTASCAADVLIVAGPSAELPWFPGLRYLGLEPGTRGLLLPTHTRCDVPAVIVENALRMRFGSAHRRLVLVPNDGEDVLARCFAMEDAGPLDVASLAERLA